MFPRTPVPPGLQDLAARQSGALSRLQVREHGLSDHVIARLVRDDRWRPIADGIYATRDDSWQQRAWAGVLLGGPDAVLGLEAAGYLQGLVRVPPARIPVYVGPDRHVRRDDRWRFIRSAREGIETPARTPFVRTVLDLSAGLSPDGIAALLGQAVGRDRSLPPRVVEELGRLSRHPNRQLLLDILGDVADGAESALEVRYARDVERAHGLPRALRQRHPSDLYRTDAWYPEYNLVVELDGRVHHEGLAAATDMDRDNLHRLEGQFTLRFGWRHVAGIACRTARQVGEVLTIRGWTGVLQPCRRCGLPSRRR